MRIVINGLLLSSYFLFVQCGYRHVGEKEKEVLYIAHQDSLTDQFLVLQDSLVQSWNWIISNDNKKIKGLENLLQELANTESISDDEFKSYSDKIHQLRRMRFSLKTLHNKHTVSEYDAASQMLIDQVFSLAESKPSFITNKTFHHLSENIVDAESKTIELRAQYDTVASTYNQFVNTHRVYIESQNLSNDLSDKNLFGY